jgi:VCBS repeat-containing protein
MLDVSVGPGKFAHRIRLVIADPKPIVLHGLKSVFATQNDFEIVASCDCGTSCLEAIRNLAPDVALVAGTLADLTVSEILAIAKAENLGTRLMFFAEAEGDDDLSAAIATGACNAVSPYADPDTIIRSLRLTTERAGAPPKPSKDFSPNEKDVDGTKIEKMLGALTHRERQIVQLVSEGLSNKEIARELNVSRGTVKVHLYNIFQKLEISNRTVLATIALLQRSTGFTTLSLALAFAILSDVKPSEASGALSDDDSGARKDLDQPLLEVWKKAILRHVVAADAGETVVLTQKGSFAKESQVTHPPARMEGLHTVEQGALSHIARGYGPIGSGSTAPFISPLQQAINDSQTSLPTAQHQFSPLQFASKFLTNHGGYGTFAMTAAGIAFSALDNPQAAAQAFEPGETLIDVSAVAIRDGTAQVAAINMHVAGKVDPANVDNLASEPVQNSHPPLTLRTLGHDSVAGEESVHQLIHVGPGDDTLNGSRLMSDTIHGSGSDTINGNDAVIGEYGGDKLTGGAGDDVLVHLSAADSNATRFDTGIDLISGTDRINLAAFGALAFLHLTSASQSVPPHTLAWIYNPVSNETIVYVNPTDRSLDIGDAGLLEIHLQGVVSAAETDFVHEPDAAAVATALEGIDPALLMAVANDGSALTTDGAETSAETEAGESTRGAAGVWTMPVEDGFRFHFGRDRTGSSDWTRLTSFDNSDHGTEEREVGAGIIPVHISPIELANSQATAPTEENPAFKKGSVYTNVGADTIGHGNPHANAGLELTMQSAAIATPVAVEETSGSTTGNGRGHDSSQHASQPAAAKASDAAELAERGAPSHNAKSDHASRPASGGEPPAAALNGPGDAPGHGNSQHPSQAASAKTSSDAEPTEPAGTPGRGNSDHSSSSASVKASAAAELAASSDPPGHGNSEHPSHSASVKASAADKSAEPDVTPGSADHNNSHTSHPASTSAAEPAAPVEPGAVPGNGVDHRYSKNASSTAADQKFAATDLIEPSDAPSHGNSKPASVSEVAVGDHGNSSHASHTASVNPLAVIHQPTEPAPGTSGAGPEPAFHFKNQAASSSPTAEVDLTELHDPPVHCADLTAILETDPAPLEVHGNGHVQSAQHHALAHLPHELLP